VQRGLLYARTARNLRWRQWLFRVIRKVQSGRSTKLSVGVDVSRERVERLADAVAEWWCEGADEMRRAGEVLEGEFRFLNHKEHIPEIDWNTRYVSHLWSYNLHYFDYAVDLARAYRVTRSVRYVQRFVALAESWINGTTVGKGDGWEPYPISLRVVNWLYALLLFGDAVDSRKRRLIESSAALQLAFLERRVEYHILANHLQKNLKALTIGGLYFQGPEADRWFNRGSRLLWRELFEQVLEDGGHFERSPMYHAIALADFLEVIGLLDAVACPVPAEARARVHRMVDAFGILSRPDGTLHLFNDAANGVAPARSWIDSLARRTVGEPVPERSGVVSLAKTGYYGLNLPETGVRLLVDCGEPGPTYQPGHAHCDLLSFELDLDGQPVIVDSGVRGYAGDPLREYVRSTRAHNTVMVAGKEQAEIWSVFRMARRPRVRNTVQSYGADQYRYSGSYSPYHSPNVEHKRDIEYGDGVWRITDRVHGAHGAQLSSFLHLHPSVSVESIGGSYRLITRTRTFVVEPFGMDQAMVVVGGTAPPQGWYCPEFGVAIPSPVIVMCVHENDGRPFGFVIREDDDT